ncbi:MAG: hypothetical protein HY901_07640, partial [Deltaproteobacteria bacterium]|nr:hypothetical protein [Deltaproteobacteria bacterium]
QVDGTQDACGTCHAMPPSGSFPGYSAEEGVFTHTAGPHENYTCSRCHPTVNASNQFVQPANHVNGVTNLNATGQGCSCH